jgi:hypothetical protein
MLESSGGGNRQVTIHGTGYPRSGGYDDKGFGTGRLKLPDSLVGDLRMTLAPSQVFPIQCIKDRRLVKNQCLTLAAKSFLWHDAWRSILGVIWIFKIFNIIPL